MHLLTPKEAAKKLGVHEKILKQEAKAGRISYVQIRQRKKFTLQALNDYLISNMVQARNSDCLASSNYDYFKEKNNKSTNTKQSKGSDQLMKGNTYALLSKF